MSEVISNNVCRVGLYKHITIGFQIKTTQRGKLFHKFEIGISSSLASIGKCEQMDRNDLTITCFTLFCLYRWKLADRYLSSIKLLPKYLFL